MLPPVMKARLVQRPGGGSLEKNRKGQPQPSHPISGKMQIRASRCNAEIPIGSVKFPDLASGYIEISTEIQKRYTEAVL